MIPRERWRFARADGGRAVPDAGHIHLDGGFEKGRLYQITYTAEGAPVQGLAMAALRDCVAWLKHGGAEAGNPAPGRLRWAYGYGRSQTGRLLRTLIHEDLNLDEQGREALDGVIANVAGGMRGEFNQRFGQHSKDRNNMMAHLFPFTDQPQAEPETGAKDALHARLDARGSRLRVYYTNSSAEYHRGDASLIHTDPDGTRDVPSGAVHARLSLRGDGARSRHLAAHGLAAGARRPDRAGRALAEPPRRGRLLGAAARLPGEPRPLGGGRDRAAAEPSPAPGGRHRGAARPPRVRLRRGSPPPATRATTRGRAASTGARCRPPLASPSARSSPRWTVTATRLGGIILPEIAVPLAAHTGWNLRHPDIGGAEQLLVFAGAVLPLARDRAEREATGDPRRSVAERYASREQYLDRVRQAAEALAREGYMLADDVPLSVAAGARFWDHFTR